jgi:hypothetical protein
LETTDEDGRDELQARIGELRDRYQSFVNDALVAEVEEIDTAGRPADG